jgi:O-antigen/teichoic acid export membrane protein
MIKKRQTFTNAGTSIVQVILSGVILFVLYRFLLITIGVEQLGIWSIVLATTTVTHISNLGLSGSVVKFVAKYVARAELENVSGVIQTAALSLSGLIGLILLIIYPLLQTLLEYIVPDSGLPDALSILPYALVSLWITAIASIFQAGLDGCQRIDLRNILLIGTNLLYLGLVFLWVPSYGLLGLAYAQVFQASSVLIVSWLLLRRELNVLPLVPYHWHRNLFFEMLSYGINFQLISIIGMLSDPLTKALLSKFGGLTMVGYYEMAYRMVIQFRAIIVNANQVLVPVIAGLQEKTPEHIEHIYKNSYRLLMYIILPFQAGLVVAIPFISKLWIGHYEKTFIIFATLIVIGFTINMLNVPAYFANLGTGRLLWNTIGHVVIGVLNGILGVVMGIYYGGMGVVVASVIAMIIGSSVIVIAYHFENDISLKEIFPKEMFLLALSCVVGLLFSLLMYYYFYEKISFYILGPISLLLFIFIVFPFNWFHPMRTQIIRWLYSAH